MVSGGGGGGAADDDVLGRLVAWDPSQGRLCAVARLKHPLVDGCVATSGGTTLTLTLTPTPTLTLTLILTLTKAWPPRAWISTCARIERGL